MAEFFESYGIWVFFTAFFVLMVWGHSRGRGMGCCGGQHNNSKPIDEDGHEDSGKAGHSCH